MELATIETPNITVMPTDEVIDYFLHNQTCQSTADLYGIKVRQFFAWAKGKPYKEITPIDALNYNEYLKSRYAAPTIQNSLSPVNQFFKFAVKFKLISDNPFSIVKQKAPPITSQNKFLTVKELDRLLNALYEKRTKHYVLGLILAATGIRISEAANLSWCDFIELPDNSVAISVTRKGGEIKLLPLRDDVFRVVSEFMGNKPLNQFDKDPIFKNASTDPAKTRATDVSLRAWIKNAAKQAKITKPVTPHTLRHTFGSLTLANNADLRSVQWAMGHKSIRSTEIYLHPQNEKVGELMPICVRGREVPAE